MSAEWQHYLLPSGICLSPSWLTWPSIAPAGLRGSNAALSHPNYCLYQMPSADAFRVSAAGKIIEVGSASELRAKAGGYSQTVDMQGRHVIPVSAVH